MLGTSVQHKMDVFAHEDNRPDEETSKANTNKYINGKSSYEGEKKMMSYEYRDTQFSLKDQQRQKSFLRK